MFLINKFWEGKFKKEKRNSQPPRIIIVKHRKRRDKEKSDGKIIENLKKINLKKRNIKELEKSMLKRTKTRRIKKRYK
jgi:hypothetical protein